MLMDSWWSPNTATSWAPHVKVWFAACTCCDQHPLNSLSTRRHPKSCKQQITARYTAFLANGTGSILEEEAEVLRAFCQSPLLAQWSLEIFEDNYHPTAEGLEILILEGANHQQRCVRPRSSRSRGMKKKWNCCSLPHLRGNSSAWVRAHGQVTNPSPQGTTPFADQVWMEPLFWESPVIRSKENTFEEGSTSSKSCWLASRGDGKSPQGSMKLQLVRTKNKFCWAIPPDPWGMLSACHPGHMMSQYVTWTWLENLDCDLWLVVIRLQLTLCKSFLFSKVPFLEQSCKYREAEYLLKMFSRFSTNRFRNNKDRTQKKPWRDHEETSSSYSGMPSESTFRWTRNCSPETRLGNLTWHRPCQVGMMGESRSKMRQVAGHPK